MTSLLRGLRNSATEVETLVREKRSPPRATASEPSYSQGHGGTTVSPRTMQVASAAAAPSSIAGASAYTHVPEPPSIAPPDVPTSATVCSTVIFEP